MRIDTSGNVGIGISAPSVRLDIVGSQYWRGAVAAGAVGVMTPDPTSGANGVNLAASFASGGYGPLTFSTAATERMRIDSSGNVGIGTTTPSTYGKFAVVAPTGQYAAGYSAANTSGYYYHATYFNNTTQIGYHYSDGTNFGLAASGASAGIIFLANGSERMRLNSSGQLCLGTTTSASGVLTIVTTGGASASMAQTGTTGDHIYFRTSTSTLAGYITSPTGTTTSYVSVSDYRLKENVIPMTGALAKVAQLKPCTYTWKSDGSDGQGFIAHELAEVVPDCVTGKKDAVNEDGSIKPQGIDTSFLVATLTAALQELKAELDVCKAEIAALKGAK